MSKNEERLRVLAFVQARWGQDLKPGDIGAEIARAARARGYTGALADYLRTLARRHNLIAKAYRLAARAADGEPISTLVEEKLHDG